MCNYVIIFWGGATGRKLKMLQKNRSSKTVPRTTRAGAVLIPEMVLNALSFLKSVKRENSTSDTEGSKRERRSEQLTSP